LVEGRIAELGLHDRVSLIGYQPDLRSAMPNFDALVMPSLWEGMPNVVLEAMAAGLPCILSDIPEHRMVCSPVGIAQLFDATSAAALTDAVCSVTASADRRRAMSDAGLKRASEFSVSNMVARHAEEYGLTVANADAVGASRGRAAAGR
jgi:glycosyltransferase involved in cell wall biosynthesis